MTRFVLLFLIFCSFSVIAQVKTEIKDGKKFIVHEVVSGNTLYSIARQYNCSISDILNNNPEAEKGLKVGQNIYLPDTSSQKTEVKETTSSSVDVKLNRTHVVQKQETLYSIAQYYNVSINDLAKLNPGIESGIKIGQTILIPDVKNKTNSSTSKNISYYDTLISHDVLAHETLYSISKRYMVKQTDITAYNGIKNNAIKPGERIYIPLKKDEIVKVDVREIKKIEEAPAKVNALENLFLTNKKDLSKIVISLPLGLSSSKEKFATIATEFYIGAQLALDSLQKMGLHAEVFVIDCSVDTLSYINQLKKHSDADLIIGPFLDASLDITARFSKTHKIKMVNPLIGSTKPLMNNPYLINAMTSDLNLMEGLASYLSKKPELGRVVLVKPGTADIALYNSFRNKLQSANSSTGVKFIECEMNEITQYFSKGMNVTVVYPSRDRNSVVKLMNTIHQNNSKVGSGKISVFGTKEWTNMDEVKNYYKNNYSFHFSMANNFSYTAPNSIDLLKLVRSKYNTDLTKSIAQGFDVVYYFVSKIVLDSKDPSKAMVINKFELAVEVAGSGIENMTSFIYKQEDFEYKLLDTIK